jgi:competence ComEA-like helix-hairpin-helix protein
MRPLYRLQQRIAITTPEAGAILFVAAVLLVGFAAQRHQAGHAAVGPDPYAALHDELVRRAAPLPADSTETDSTAVDSTGALRGTAAEGTAGPATRGRGAKPGPVRMNLNTASEQQLQRLPRIGPKMAERIVAYREEHGPFARPSHVVRVRGIGPKTFEQLAPYLFVDEADAGSESEGG